jgi:lipopolysaccharide export system protein LptA
MPLNVSRLRYWFAAAAIAALLVVASFYFYARYRYYTGVKEIPKKLGIDVQQSTDTFSLSKSEGGHTIFTIRASKAVQYTEGGRAELHDVTIVVYGRESNRFDQISGSNFEYDQETGNVIAHGEVNIDLEGNAAGQIAATQETPPELKDPIHLKTSGLTFNQKTGLAQTDRRIEFEIPNANGSAVGAKYDSKSNVLTLGSDVHFNTTGPQSAALSARGGMLTKDPRRAVFDFARLDRGTQQLSANKLTLFLRDDNTIEHVLAEGDVQTTTTGPTSMVAKAPTAEFQITGKNVLQSAVMYGGVAVHATGTNAMDAQARRVLLEFDPNAKLQRVRATGDVRVLQLPDESPRVATRPVLKLASASARTGQRLQHAGKPRDLVELTAPALDVYVRGGKVLDHAVTSGASQITIRSQQPGKDNSRTVITAASFTAGFQNNRMTSIHGAPDVRVVQSTPGQPEKVTTSQTLDATFDPSGNISGFVQQGDFKYKEGQPGSKIDRSAWAQNAAYNSVTEILTLDGSPRVVEGGMTTTARQIRLNRRTGDAEALDDVKTTYNELEPQPNGAMLASSDPVHVTAANMVMDRSTMVARYTGQARLWQGGNIIEAPVIVFDRNKRSVTAEAASGHKVSTVLIEQDKKGGSTPISITADKFTYTDKQRRALFQGDVLMRGADNTVTANELAAFLKPREPGNKTASTKAASPRNPLPGAGGPSELDRAVAEGNVVLQQPNRRGTGQKLVYTADGQKFVLTGGSPTIFDAERGTVTGASLTFYSGDDRVLVEGSQKTRAVTNTRISK